MYATQRTRWGRLGDVVKVKPSEPMSQETYPSCYITVSPRGNGGALVSSLACDLLSHAWERRFFYALGVM